MTKELELKQYSIDKPAEVAKMATVLKNHVVKHKLYSNIKGRNYAHVEGWQFAGFLLGTYPKVESVVNLSNEKEIKWQANVNIYQGDKIIGSGIAVCSSKEAIKKGFDEYAILSMAQTRAIGKAYRNIIGWVMKLAGYESTPREEMGKVGEKEPIDNSPVENGEKILECQNCAAVITEQEAGFSKKIYKKQLCRGCQSELKRKK